MRETKTKNEEDAAGIGGGGKKRRGGGGRGGVRLCEELGLLLWSSAMNFGDLSRSRTPEID